jgi:hypothetical protein
MPSRRGAWEPWASAAPRLEPVWRPPRAPRRRFGRIGVKWMPQARKATPYPRFERREGERDRERGRGGRDTGGGAHGDASGGTHGGGGGGACGGGGGSACGGERAAACMEVGAAARAEEADWRCARADWWRARAVETKYGERGSERVP